MTHKNKVTGMSCSGCVSTVQKALSEIKGVEDVKVTLTPPQAEIKMHHHIDVNEMNAALQKSGKYKIEEEA